MFTSPEPESEFRTEMEFRTRIYRFLAMGLETTEIENLLHRKIDWALYDRETVDIFRENSNGTSTKVAVSLPESLFSSTEKALSAIHEARKESSVLKKEAILIKDSLSKLNISIGRMTDLLIGFSFIAGLLGGSAIVYIVLRLL